MICPPRGGEFDRVYDEVEQDLLGLALIGAQPRQVRGQLDRCGEVAIADTRTDQLADRADRVAKVEDLIVQLELAGLGLRQVENVVDDVQEMHAALVDISDIGLVFLVRERAQYLALHHLGKADDGIQWRAQLVAHHREKTRFGAARRFGRLLGEAQRFIRCLALKLQRDPIEAAVEHREQRIRVARFVEIIIGAAAHCSDRGLAVERGRHQHANQLRLLRAQTRDHINATEEVRVDQRDRGRGTAVGRLAQRRERPLRGIDAASRIALLPQYPSERFGETEIVIDDYHRTRCSVFLTHCLPPLGRAASPPVQTLPGRAVGNHSVSDASIQTYSY